MRIDEISPGTLRNYSAKAKGQAGWAHGVSQHGKYADEPLTPEKQKYADFAAKRRAGAAKADKRLGSKTDPETYDWVKKGGAGEKGDPTRKG